MLMLWLITAVGNTLFLADSSIQWTKNCLGFYIRSRQNFNKTKHFCLFLTRVAFELLALKDFQRIFTQISAKSKAQQKHKEGVKGEQKKTMQNCSETAIAPTTTPGQVTSKCNVVCIFLFTLCAFCTVWPAPRAPFFRAIRVITWLINWV